MTTAKLPVPGIVLGDYPEKRDGNGVSLPVALLLNLLDNWHGRRLTRHQHFVARIRSRQEIFAAESQQSFQLRIHDLRARLGRDGFIDALLVDAFAIAFIVSSRELGVTPYDTQLIAARIMLDNQLAEMATGEGKTLAAAIAVATAALAGVPVHVITSNDYLVERDAQILLPLYHALGLSVGTVLPQMDVAARKTAYACDITYCTAKELVFDYLRDGLARPRRSLLEQRAASLSTQGNAGTLLRGLCMAIIDEADSILIDEARVPLVLSRAALAGMEQTDYQQAWELSARLLPIQHFNLEPAARNVQLTASGRARLQELAAEQPEKWLTARHCEDAVKTALAARHLLQRDRDYLIKDDKVMIIDENTGRTADGRAWSRGLHQLVEIKEACTPTAHTTTLTQITYQRFFSRYLRLGGMSGTLMEVRSELLRVYNVGVTPVPLRRPSRRNDMKAIIFDNQQEMWHAAVNRVRALHAQGRPVLIGTDSVVDSETISRHLSAAELPHTVLNARQDQREAQLIASAGNTGAITVATNMAGRGTDIELDSGVEQIGGLHVISCQQNAARRIDRQLMGRCARQGNSGSTERFIALDGPLLAGRWQSRLVRWLMQFAIPHQNWLGHVALRLSQQAEERHQKFERKMLLQRDKELARWFSFSGTED
ncbi:MAG: hypothetical protein Q7T21_06120 [Gallionella sp.]|nr:hypothetical protein [Gallionella sp.]